MNISDSYVLTVNKKNRPPVTDGLSYALFWENMLSAEKVEIAEHVKSDYKKYKYRSKHLCPARKKCVDGTSLVL